MTADQKLSLLCRVLDQISGAELHALTGAPLAECEQAAKIVREFGK